jgi:hypothetical protein
LTYRTIGYAITGLLSLVVAYRIFRRRDPTVFALGLAAATLIAFAFLTTMHDRYSYAAIVFLALVPDRRRVAAFSVLVGGLIMWNLVASASAAALLDWGWPIDGPAGVIGSLGFCAAALISIAFVWAEGRGAPSALEASLRQPDPTELAGASAGA